MSEYLEIKAEASEGPKPRFYFTIGKRKFDLPHLADTIELLEAALLAQAGQIESAAAHFAGYFRQYQPSLFAALRAQDAPNAYMLEVVKQWTEHSKIDPKASN